MILGTVFEQFIKESPISVMARATVEHAFSASALDELFKQKAELGYTRDLLFSTTVELMSRVVCGKAPHVQSAYQHILDRVPVTLKCVYEKLQLLTARFCSRAAMTDAVPDTRSSTFKFTCPDPTLL